MHFITKNIFQSEKCLLTSSTPTSESGLTTSIPGFLNYLTSLGNPSKTRVLIISGSHGDPHDKVSGFSHKDLLDNSLYEETCELVGVEPQRKRDKSIPLSSSTNEKVWATGMGSLIPVLSINK